MNGAHEAPDERSAAEVDGDGARAAHPGPPASAGDRGERESRAARRFAERARDVAAASRDRFSFLAEVSRCLAESLDYETTLATVAGMALPYLDAWCIVDVVVDGAAGSGAGGIRRLAVLHPDPDRQAAALALQRDYPPRSDDLIGPARVIRTRRPELVFDVPDEALAASARGPAHLALLRTLGVSAYVIVPMIARGRVLGAITFVTAEAGRRFGDIDVVLAEDIARRAAVAVDNARLHGESVAARRDAEAALADAEYAVAALEASEARFRAVQANSPAGFALLAPVRSAAGAIVDFEYTFVNPAGARLLERAGGAIVGQRLTTVCPGEAGAGVGVIAACVQVAEAGEPAERELRQERNGGDAGFHLTLVRVEGGVAMTFTDITERLRAEAFQREFTGHLARWNAELQASAEERERLLAESERARVALDEGQAERERLLDESQAARGEAEAANRAKGDFLATMSHEFRTPLNAIAGYAELMEMGIRGPVTAQQREDLARIQRSQRHLLGLVNEVLNYAKLETGTVYYDLEDVIVCDALASAEALVSPQAQAKGLTLVASHYPPRLTVRADVEKLRQAVVNLLSNAVKFTDPGGRVTTSCAETAAGVVAVRVTDTGIGIPADQLERIFEPFVQVRTDLRRMAEGTGLGLAISRDLARGMGGDLTVESELGVGSTFTLTLPAAPAHRAVAPAG